MRRVKEEILKEELRVLAIRTRNSLDLTQSEMAKRLEMQEDVGAFFLDLKSRFSDKCEKKMRQLSI